MCALAGALQHRRLLQAESAEVEQTNQQHKEDGQGERELDQDVAAAVRSNAACVG